ncbi:acyltransferase, partial [bacterium]|nr:acyltransferase [bacterium]
TYRKDIQILRGTAVIFVVLYHLGIGGFNSGFIGVDVFFVISGFLMGVLYNENKKLEFYKRRSLRLLPAYFVTIIATLLASVFIVTPNEYNQVFRQSLYSESFASNIGFWMQNSYFSKSEFNPLLHLWSLGVEVQFYLLIPILFFFIKLNRMFFWILFTVSLSLCFVIVEISPKTSFFMLPLRLWEFLIGYGVAKYITANGIPKSRSFSFVGSISLLVICAIPLLNVKETQSFITGHPGIYALIITLLTGCILAFGINKLIENSTIGHCIEVVGKYSYSVYLVHFPVIVLFLYQPFYGTILKANSFYNLLTIIVLITILSCGMYHFVEVKIRKYKHINVLLLIFPILIVSIAYAGLIIQKQAYTNKEMLIFVALQDKDTYRCGKMFQITQPTEIFCEITDSNTVKKQNMLFVGDSHADSLKYSFAAVASSLDSGVYFLSPNTKISKNSRINSKRIIDEALSKNATSIILHYSRNGVNTSIIKETIELAAKENILVAFIMPVPTWDTHIPAALWNNHIRNVPLPLQTINDYNENHSKIRDSISKIPFGNFKIYEVAQDFCDEDCSLIDDTGKPLYSDTSHLTLTGSSKLFGLFETIVTDSYSHIEQN